MIFKFKKNIRLYFVFIFIIIFSNPTFGQLDSNLVHKYIDGRAEMNNSHLFMSDNFLKNLNKLYNQNDAIVSVGVKKLKLNADSILKTPLLKYYLDEANLRIPSIHDFASQIPLLTLAYQLTKEDKYAQRIWSQLELMCTYPDWGANRHFLDAGIAGFNCSFALDGLKNYLTKAQKEKLYNTVKKFILEPAKPLVRNNIWWHNATNNWNGVCNGGIIMSILSIENSTDYNDLLKKCIFQLPTYLQTFEPDGQSEEGVAYWRYGLFYTTLTIEAISNTFKNSFGLDQYGGFKKSGWFPIKMSGPVSTLNIGDDPIKNFHIKSLPWFFYHYNDSVLSSLHYKIALSTNDIDWVDLIYYNPILNISNRNNHKLELNQHISGIDIMSLRSDWSKNAFYISLHGGHNNANHGHLDAGSFELQALGEVWAYGNLGKDDYTFPGYFTKKTNPSYTDSIEHQETPGRWHFYRLRAEGKNTLVFNNSIKPDQYENGIAKFQKLENNKNYSYSITDLTDCYFRDVKEYKRGILLTKDKTILIQDEFKCIGKKNIWWSMHTKASILLTNNGKTAILTLGDKKMSFNIKATLDAKFEILPATYLPGENFPLTLNSKNEGFKKLAVHIKNADSGILQILVHEFHPDIKINSKINTLSQWPNSTFSFFKIPNILQSNMVIQQNQNLKIWGYGIPGASITIKPSWGYNKICKIQEDGNWSYLINVPKAIPGKYLEHSIQLESIDTKISLKKILFGEVWLTSGQSNMDMSMQPFLPWHLGVQNHEFEIKNATNKFIRFIKIPKTTSEELMSNTGGNWLDCDTINVKEFSGVSFYFAKKLQKNLKIPIGIIQSAYGSASAQAFMDRNTLRRDSVLRKKYLDPYDANPNEKIPVLRPTLIYNAMIHPIINYSIKGFLWYQGESNAGDINLYTKLNIALIRQWRHDFNNKFMPFYYVQMTPYNWKKTDSLDYNYALFRETQEKILNEPHTQMVTTMDVGEPDNIHPRNKKAVGERLANFALYDNYKFLTSPYGPSYSSLEIKGKYIYVNFRKNSVTNGLITSDGLSPRHFFIAGKDKVFRSALATIINNKIKLYSDSVSNPIAVRYAFTNFPETNLQNKIGLPAYPFRTDTWKDTQILKK
jgi:sialate O-acetylesterase